MDQLSMKNEEKLINNILFLYILGVAISGWAFVMIFLNGGARECVFLLSGLSAIVTKLLEKSLGNRKNMCTPVSRPSLAPSPWQCPAPMTVPVMCASHIIISSQPFY